MPRNHLHTMLRVALAFVWVWTGIVVLVLYPLEESLALIAPLGLPDPVARALIWGTAAIELLMGLIMLGNWWVQALALIQLVLIAAFTLIITVFLPEQWLHPFGAISKNVPLFVATWILYRWERERNRQRKRLYSFENELEP